MCTVYSKYSVCISSSHMVSRCYEYTSNIKFMHASQHRLEYLTEFIFYLFDYAVTDSHYTASYGKMIGELERMWKESIMV
jgi:hypothetical protein